MPLVPVVFDSKGTQVQVNADGASPTLAIDERMSPEPQNGGGQGWRRPIAPSRNKVRAGVYENQWTSSANPTSLALCPQFSHSGDAKNETLSPSTGPSAA